MNTAITRYSAAGVAALKPEGREKKQCSGRVLNEVQETAIRQIICDKRQEQLKMEFALWNRAAGMQLIERECGIKLSVRGVGKLLQALGIAFLFSARSQS